MMSVLCSLAIASAEDNNAKGGAQSGSEKGTPGRNVESEFDRIRRVQGENGNQFFESAMQVKGIIPLHGAFARFWLNRELPEANRMLRQAQQLIIKEEGGNGVMTAKIAATESVKWQMRTWNRIYQLFNDKSRFYPGRLDKETQAMMEEMFWLYVCDKSRFERAGLQYAFAVHGSENHEMMHYSNALLALQALKDRPAYKDRKLPDGRSPQEHYEAWNAYYKLYCEERAKHGLLVEVFSEYGSYTMPELLNMYDLAEDPVLRTRMEKLIHLIWADWAVGQLNGVRGGARVRIYQGDPHKLEKEFQWGTQDRWRLMSQRLLDSGKWWVADRGASIHGCLWFLRPRNIVCLM